MSVKNILDGTIPVGGEGLTPESRISVKHVYSDLGLNTPGDVVGGGNITADEVIYGATVVTNRVKIPSAVELADERYLLY